MVFIFEDKGTTAVTRMRKTPLQTHRIEIRADQLDWYCDVVEPASMIPVYYVLPRPPWNGGASSGHVPEQAACRVAAAVTRLAGTWKAGQHAFAQRGLSGAGCVWLRADGIDVDIGLAKRKLCVLVMTGVRADGRDELIALADGCRGPAGSRAGLLRYCARRGMRALVLAAGDGALGFRDALREVFPGARQGRCWFRKTASVLAALPGSAHPGAKQALAGIWGAGDEDHARAAVKASGAAYGLKFPEAAAKITGDLGELPACCGYPAGRRARLRAASPVEPAVAAVRHRARVTQGPGSGAAGLAMAFKGIQAARDHWRMASTAHLAALVRAGARSGRGVLTGRPGPAAA